jgi:serine phosphatase RsbU (regulator of sigma subunit)
MKKQIGVILLIVLFASVRAQNISELYRVIDSLYVYNKTDKCLKEVNNLEKLSIKLKNDSVLAYAYCMQAKVYYKNRKYNKSIKYFEKELVVNNKIAKDEDLAESYYNLGSTCLKVEKLNKAKVYFDKSLKISKKANFKVMIYANYEALYTVYYELNNYKMALYYYKKMQGIDEQEYNETIGLFQRRYFDQKQKTNEEKKRLNEAQANLGDTKQQLNKNHNKISSYQEKLKKMEKDSIERMKAIISLYDQSISTEMHLDKKQEELTKKQKELTKKQKELIRKQEELREQRRYVITLAVGIIIILALSLFMYKLFLSKKKMNKNLLLQKDKISEQNFQINNSMHYARKIQNAVLTSNELLTDIFTDNFILFNPREIVSGDFYWFYKNDNIFWGAIVDCTGHGVPGAFMSIIGNNLLNTIIREDAVIKPSKLLSRLNEEVKQTLNKNSAEEISEDGMDMTVVKVDLLKKQISLSLANHTAFIIQNNEISVIEGDIFSIGDSLSNSVEVSYTDFEFNYKDTETQLYMFSDGFQDQFGGANDKKYTQKQLKEKLFEIHEMKFDKQKEIMKTELKTWKGDKTQIDDILLVGIKF